MKKENLNRSKKEKDWYRIKKYPHIGEPLKLEDRDRISRYVGNPIKIASHGFYPFIKRTLTKRRFRRNIENDGSRSKLRYPKKKEREVFYANHIDSNIYSYYACLLAKNYEDVLKSKGLDKCVLAYRRIPVDPTNANSRNCCNVDFANEIFSHIRSRQPNDLVAITFDIKSFFDTLDHKVLKQRWKQVLGELSDLPDDHYNVFKNITKFSYVYENHIFKKYKEEILVERSSGITKRKSIAKKKHLRNQRAVAYCTLDEIHDIRKSNLIKANKYLRDSSVPRRMGIPQGSPISATLANIYMLSFDEAANKFMETVGGVYRRYSDDMVVVCPVQHEQTVIDFMQSRIHGDDCKLEIQETKTQIFHFVYKSQIGRFSCAQRNINTGELLTNTKFEYLGFQFDGQHVLLRNASLAAYYRKMKKSIRRGIFYSVSIKNQTRGVLFKGRLYKKFTHLGANRRRIYKRQENHPDRFVLTKRYDWGNYLSYVYMAASNMEQNKIKRQLRNHWKIFNKLIKR